MLHSRSSPTKPTLKTLPFDVWHYLIKHLAFEKQGREVLKALRLVIHDPELQEAMLKAICETVRSYCTRQSRAERQDQLLAPEQVAILDTYVKHLEIRGDSDLESTKLGCPSVQMTRLARQPTTQSISLRNISAGHALYIMWERGSVDGNWELHLGCSEEGASLNSGNGQSWIELYAREQHCKLSKTRCVDSSTSTARYGQLTVSHVDGKSG